MAICPIEKKHEAGLDKPKEPDDVASALQKHGLSFLASVSGEAMAKKLTQAHCPIPVFPADRIGKILRKIPTNRAVGFGWS